MIRFKKATARSPFPHFLFLPAWHHAPLQQVKQKVGKINLTIDTDIRSGSSGGEVEVTAYR